MTAAELMLYDWVLVDSVQVDVDKVQVNDEYKNSIYQLPAQVEGLFKGVVVVDGCKLPPCLCLPIPLTREILERNGFCDLYKDRSLNKDNVFKWYDVYGHCVTVDMNANAIKIQHDSRVLLDMCYNIVVPVHELQHTIRQCGIDKDIEL